MIYCEINTDIPFPTDPLIKFALPEALFSLIIVPNPISASDPTQEWIITETNNVGFDAKQIILKTFDQNNNFIREEFIDEGRIRAMFESNYFPPDTSISGTINNDITDPAGFWIQITILGIDDNKNNISTECVLNIQ